MRASFVFFFAAIITSYVAAGHDLCDGSYLGLPELTTLPIDASLAHVGRALFSERRLSADGLVSCATCHLPASDFADALSRPKGIRRQQGTRNAPSLLNVAYATELFWDGRARTLEAQATMPMLNALEHGLKSEEEIVRIVRDSPGYVARFSQAGAHAPPSIDDVRRALAQYERTLRSGGSPFDRYLYANESGAMSASAVRGLALFRGRAGCASCHTINGHEALFTDQKYHVSPLGVPPAALTSLATNAIRVEALKKKGDEAALNSLISSDADVAALGRFVVTLNPADIGAYRTPSLRNVARTAPYMHDGSVSRLEEALEFELYGHDDASRKPLVLSAEDKADLLEFLKALSSPPPCSS
jgi:cytochrome c peroxidase